MAHPEHAAGDLAVGRELLKRLIKRLAISAAISFGILVVTGLDALIHQRERGDEVIHVRRSAPFAAPAVVASLVTRPTVPR